MVSDAKKLGELLASKPVTKRGRPAKNSALSDHETESVVSLLNGIKTLYKKSRKTYGGKLKETEAWEKTYELCCKWLNEKEGLELTRAEFRDFCDKRDNAFVLTAKIYSRHYGYEVRDAQIRAACNRVKVAMDVAKASSTLGYIFHLFGQHDFAAKNPPTSSPDRFRSKTRKK